MKCRLWLSCTEFRLILLIFTNHILSTFNKQLTQLEKFKFILFNDTKRIVIEFNLK